MLLVGDILFPLQHLLNLFITNQSSSHLLFSCQNTRCDNIDHLRVCFSSESQPARKTYQQLGLTYHLGEPVFLDNPSSIIESTSKKQYNDKKLI